MIWLPTYFCTLFLYTSGHYVPQLAELVYESNNYRKDVINLKGFIVSLPFKLNHTSCLTKRLKTQHHFEAENINLQVGNPETDDYYDSKGIVEYAWSHAVISDQLYRQVNQVCNFKLPNWPPECSNAVSSVFGQLQEIDIYNIYAPTCPLKKTISPTYPKACLLSGNNPSTSAFSFISVLLIPFSLGSY